MQGRHAFEPESRKTIDLESFVADEHYLRKVNRVLELSFVVELTAECYSIGKGRPSIDPEVYFRMLLMSYIYDIQSDRRLCEEVRYNLAYRWFCHLSLEDSVPAAKRRTFQPPLTIVTAATLPARIPGSLDRSLI